MDKRAFVIGAIALMSIGFIVSQGTITGFFAKNIETGYSVVDFPVQHTKTLRGTAVENGITHTAEAKITIKFDPVKSSSFRSLDKVTPEGTLTYFLASWSAWGPEVFGSVTFNGKEYLIDSSGSSSSFSASEKNSKFSYAFTSTGVTLGTLSGVSTIELSGENGLYGSDNLPRLNGNEKASLKISGPVSLDLSELSIPLP